MSLTNQRIGLVSMVYSVKATFAILVFAVSSVALFLHLLDSTAFSAIIGVVSSVFMASHAASNVAAINASAAMQQQLLVKAVPTIDPKN